MEDFAVSFALLVMPPPALGVSNSTFSGLAVCCYGVEDSAISWLMMLPPAWEALANNSLVLTF